MRLKDFDSDEEAIASIAESKRMAGEKQPIRFDVYLRQMNYIERKLNKIGITLSDPTKPAVKINFNFSKSLWGGKDNG